MVRKTLILGSKEQVKKHPSHGNTLNDICCSQSPEGSCVEGLVPKAAFKHGTLWNWVDREGSDPINGLIHCWIHDCMVLLEDDGKFRRWGLVGEGDHWRHATEGYSLSSAPFLSLFASWLPWSEQLSSTTPFCHDVPPLQTHTNGARWQWSKTSEIIKQNETFLLLSCFLQVFCHNDTESWVTKHFPMSSFLKEPCALILPSTRTLYGAKCPHHTSVLAACVEAQSLPCKEYN
jgi:hypothetical protein